jgi:hypothetical protein
MTVWRCLVVVVAVSACGSKAKPPPPVVKAEAPAFSGKPVDAPVLTLLAPGAEPRRALRYKPVYGARSLTNTRMTMDTNMTAAGQPYQIQPPPMTMVMETVVTEVGSSTFDIAMKVTATDVEPGGNPALSPGVKTAIAKIVGMTTLGRIDHRGVMIAADTVMPANAPPEAVSMAKSMDQITTQATAPFPEEAVGVGARWSVVSEIETSGMKLTQTAVYQLLELTGDKGRISVAIEQTAPAQDVKTPGMAPDMKAHLVSAVGHGTSTIAFDLADVVPAAVDMTVDLEVAMTMTSSGVDAEVAMTMKVGIEMTSAPIAR